MIKLFLIIAISLLYVFLGTTSKGRKMYYFLTVLMLAIRELNVPFIGDITPAAVMAAILYVSTIHVKSVTSRRWIPYVIYLLLSILVAYLVSPEFHRAFEWVFNLFLVMAFAVLPTKLFTHEDDSTMLSRTILIVSFIFSLATILAYWGFADGTIIIASEELGDSFQGSRVYGLAGSNLINCVCVITFVLLPSAKIKKKWLEIAYLVIVIYAALITLKRMTTISMCMSLVYYILMQMKDRKSIKSIIVISIVVCAFAMFWEPIMQRFAIAGFGDNELEDHSTESRLLRYAYAFDIFKRFSLLGGGAGHVIFVHNGLLEILANCGILGVVFVFFRYLPNFKDIKRLNPWAIAVIIYLTTCFMLESSINQTQILSFLGVFLGGYYCSVKSKVDADKHSYRKIPDDSQTNSKCV